MQGRPSSPLVGTWSATVFAKLQRADGGVAIREFAPRSLELMVRYDQLEVASLTSAEFMCPLIQLTEHRWRE